MSSNGSAADDYPASRIPWVFLALGLGISAAVVFFLIIAGATEPFGGATNRFVPSVPEVRGPAPGPRTCPQPGRGGLYRGEDARSAELGAPRP